MTVAEQSLEQATNPSFLASSVGRKLIMALTGALLFGFVTIHMIGNLQAYLGREAFNGYARFLHELFHGAGIWIFRAILLMTGLLHTWAALSLTLDNWKARPKGYRAQRFKASTWSSRTMRWSGVILLSFIVFHLLHLTTGHAHPTFSPGDAYANFVSGFRSLGVSTFYLVAQLCLGLHLWHGVWSFTQTLGWSHPRYDRLRRSLATVLTIAVVGGNVSFPLAVLTGIIR